MNDFTKIHRSASRNLGGLDLHDDVGDLGDEVRFVKQSSVRTGSGSPKWSDYDVRDSATGRVTRVRYNFESSDDGEDETYTVEER